MSGRADNLILENKQRPSRQVPGTNILCNDNADVLWCFLMWICWNFTCGLSSLLVCVVLSAQDVPRESLSVATCWLAGGKWLQLLFPIKSYYGYLGLPLHGHLVSKQKESGSMITARMSNDNVKHGRRYVGFFPIRSWSILFFWSKVHAADSLS